MEIEKVARQIVCGFIIFAIVTFTLVLAEPDVFIEVVSKGFFLAVVAIPSAHMHYGNEFNYKFKDL